MSKVVQVVSRLKPLVPYTQALSWMADLSAAKNLKEHPDPRDVLFVLQHRSVYTLGRRGANPEFIKFDLNRPPCEVYNTERGGDITYHGPGQITVYPVLQLQNYKKDLHWYVDSLEEVVLSTLKDLGIEAHGDPDNPGVWVNGNEKVGSIGIRMRRWVTTHGISLNVLPSVLPYFDQIVACGLEGRTAVDIKTLMSRQQGGLSSSGRVLLPTSHLSDEELIQLVADRFVHQFQRVMDVQVVPHTSQNEQEFYVKDEEEDHVVKDLNCNIASSSHASSPNMFTR